ncbi:succinate dehydrogenase, hydrophobic membrane anchor protein [Pseudomaricurvus sp. HS19]|uniref:succinate dehydrogenase, hydrophobic membrane anchor protein n=1 Tax=Pseudomaricurvus sp. HS19 TaxID=2692626 RepID=UPI001368D74D|nr:succinate dehydrogenase, hydrophobic membrane anchor protein [Pseudomaricurvus sp. HS19]MYM62756.1 succinate dehydrogenase, hydrophobic membrane anchor protein [Pseudomaricurvus sp. HS19]
MVTAVTSFGRSGLYDWLIQRVSAVVMAAYLVFIVAFILCTPEMTYAEWKGLYSHLWMRIFSLATLLSIAAHAWIGLWAVLTDYITNRMMGAKATVLRLLAQVVLGVITVTYVVWGIEILWGF